MCSEQNDLCREDLRAEADTNLFRKVIQAGIVTYKYITVMIASMLSRVLCTNVLICIDKDICFLSNATSDEFYVHTDVLVPLDNYISRGTAHFLTSKDPDYQLSLWNMICSVSCHYIKRTANGFDGRQKIQLKVFIVLNFVKHFILPPNPIYVQKQFAFVLQMMADKNLEDNDIEPAPKLIEVVFQNCRGQVDHWVEPYLRITVECLHCAVKPYFKCLLMQVVRLSQL